MSAAPGALKESLMRTMFRAGRVVVAGLAAASLLGVSGVAYAVVQSVDSSPQPQVVIPSSATARTDDPSTHDAGDDRNRVTQERHGVDDPVAHDVGDDNGVDEPATHDVRDRNDGAANRHTSDGAAPMRTADDHGRDGRDD
jgi:hypothetical protein